MAEHCLVHPQLPSMSTFPCSYSAELIGRIVEQSQDSNDDDVCWSIRWPHKVIRYKGDIDDYIWRPHGRTPSVGYADLFIPIRATHHLPSILLLFSTSRLLRAFKQQFASELVVFSSLPALMLELLHVIHAVFRLALSETKECLQDTKQQLCDMVRYLPGPTSNALTQF